MSRLLKHAICFASLLVLSVCSPAGADEPRKLVHYMPWYGSEPVSGAWGWHWTMGHFDPDVIDNNGRREAASHDYPAIGLYDSGDPDALECQVLQMKFAGISGVIVDWYGTEDFNDYAKVHANTEALIPFLKKAGLEFAVCYEDQSIGHMVKGGKLDEAEAVSHAKEVFQWLESGWFADKNYVKVEGQPLMLVFGPQYFEPAQWADAVAAFQKPPRIHALPHLAGKFKADGPFGWPPVADGKTLTSAEWRKDQERLYASSGENESVVALAFPGFHDIYAEAELHDSYGRIDARGDKTFRESLGLALQSDSDIIQIATWNDYGEGTVIEPTENYGYRYLEAVQEVATDTFSPEDLRVPARLYQLRKRFSGKADATKELDAASVQLFVGDVDSARGILDKLEASHGGRKRSAAADIAYKTATNVLYYEGDNLSDYQKQRCRLDLYYPAGAKDYATVVWFHGGGLTGGNRTVPEPLKNRGIAVATVNYRLNPKVESPVYIEDAAASVAWIFKNIEKHGGSADKIFISGHSAGGYLASMVGLDKSYLEAHGINADLIAGLIPFSGHTITHFTVRKERGIGGNQPVIDALAPLFHVRKDCPPILFITGDRELEIMGRYEENAYCWRMFQVVKHPDSTLRELDGYDHGGMPEPAFPLLLKFVREKSEE